MLGPLTIVSLEQGKLYGKSMKLEQALCWQSAASNDPETATVESARENEVARTGFWAVMWFRLIRFRVGFLALPRRGLTGH
jgi:hypothetical protein